MKKYVDISFVEFGNVVYMNIGSSVLIGTLHSDTHINMSIHTYTLRILVTGSLMLVFGI